MKFPIGIQTLDQIIEDNYVYVDKTALVYKMVSEGKVYFLSRPRRFGKSLLVSTLETYFQGRREIFKGLAIDKLETEWHEYPVFHLDFNGLNFTMPCTLEKALEAFVSKVEAEYGKDEFEVELGKRFYAALKNAKQKTGRGCVILIDEYDKPLLDVMGTPQEETNRNVLKAFYSTFKAADKYTKFVFLTGVTKFSQVSVFSGFNQPEDLSMNPEFEAICGITEEELHAYFTGEVETLAKKLKCSAEDAFQKIKRHYDGYHFSENLTDIYNPFSLLNAFKSGRIGDFWFSTGTPTYLVKLMEDFRENLSELLSKPYEEAEFADYRATSERPVPMLYQSGYLTIKSYDSFLGTYELGFPNGEVKRGFTTMLAESFFQTKESVISWLSKIVNALRFGRPDDLRAALASFFAGVPYALRKKGDEKALERDFQYAFFLIMHLVSGYFVVAEKQTSNGRVDCVVETDKFVYIFEFKRDGTAAEALEQIEERGYAQEYEADARQLFKIGCSFSTETGTISDWISEPCAPREG